MIFFYYICGQSHCQRMLSLNGRCHRTILMTLVNQEGTVRQSVLIPIRKGMNVPIKLMIIIFFLSCHQKFFSIFITNECTRIDMALQSYRLLLFCFFFFVRILLICDTNDICLELWSAKWDSTEARRVYTFFILYTEYNHTPQSTHVKFIKNEVVNFPNLYPNDVS